MKRGPKNSFRDLTAQQVRERFSYNRKTGILTWKISPSNNVKAGSPISSVGRLGYIRVSINNKRYLAHRIIWLWVTGKWPKYEIDHRDQNSANNKWKNLRQATPSQNHQNRGPQKNNTSGYKGVFWNSSDQRWNANIKLRGHNYRLYAFTSAKAAHIARCAESRRLRRSFDEIK